MQAINDVCAKASTAYVITHEWAAQLYSPFLSNIAQVKCRILPNAPMALISSELNAREVGEGSNLGVIESSSPRDMLFENTIGGLRVESPILAYLDLLGGEGRSKELAEHLMLLDLGRNDVGRVAEVGTVTVTEKMQIELYSHVMHIVSNVEGKLSPHYDAMDALFAGFPAGTVSGAPKVRAMEIIDELEPDRRSFYAGCIGYFAANGSMDSCIALRTALVKDGIMVVQAGAGIVADSVPESEHQECWNKARALLRAAEEAVRFSARQGR